MTDKQTLLHLAERVEGIDGPCRETDRDIADALGLGPHDTWDRPKHRPGIHSMSVGSWRKGGIIRHSQPYTGSLDAAASLMPEGWVINHIGYRADDFYEIEVAKTHKSAFIKCCYAKTECNARVAAALRAIAEEME